ncbi:MAG: hypothetical protein GY786_18560 [Proteobacteria bacterium]|nr:hypothetical protein [Pseudomonadota bacterium]
MSQFGRREKELVFSHSCEASGVPGDECKIHFGVFLDKKKKKGRDEASRQYFIMISEEDRHSLVPTGMGFLLDLSRVMNVLVVILSVSFVIGVSVSLMWVFPATLFGGCFEACLGYGAMYCWYMMALVVCEVPSIPFLLFLLWTWDGVVEMKYLLSM